MQWRIQGRGSLGGEGEGGTPPYFKTFLDQTEGRRERKKFFGELAGGFQPIRNGEIF